jgi:hypothetical protein
LDFPALSFSSSSTFSDPHFYSIPCHLPVL